MSNLVLEILKHSPGGKSALELKEQGRKTPHRDIKRLRDRGAVIDLKNGRYHLVDINFKPRKKSPENLKVKICEALKTAAPVGITAEELGSRFKVNRAHNYLVALRKEHHLFCIKAGNEPSRYFIRD